jgi:amino acid adenylation domain-containing protein
MGGAGMSVLEVLGGRSSTIEREMTEEEPPQRSGVTPDGPFPLSRGQRDLWLAHEVAPLSPAYNVGLAARAAPYPDAAALEDAAADLAARHAALRTTYSLHEGEPHQEIHAGATIELERITPVAGSDLAAQVQAAHRRPFDLACGPLLRLTLFSPARGAAVLLLSAHHIAVDFWSLLLLFDDLRQLYAAEVLGRRAGLPPPGPPYIELVRWQSRHLASPAGEEDWLYWRDRFAGERHALALPTDRARPAVPSQRGGAFWLRLGAEPTAGLKRLARSEGSTLFVALLAAFGALLGRWAEQDQVVVGSPVTGRSRADFEPVVGTFVNLLPLTVDLAGRPGFAELIRRLRPVVLAGLAHQDFPLGALVERLGAGGDPGRAGLFQVTLTLQQPHRLKDLSTLLLPATGAGTRVAFGDVSLTPFPLLQQEGQLDLGLEAMEDQGTLGLFFKYSSDLFDEPTVARLVEHWQVLVEGALAAPAAALRDLPLLPEAERHQVVTEWNATAAPGREEVLHRLFAAQAERSPEAVAVELAGEEVTYRELARRAGRMAAHLASLGVREEVLVGVCMERSIEMAVAVLGILQAGGAFVPLDPDDPAERLAHLLADAEVRAVLTQPHLRQRLPPGVPVVCLEAGWGAGGPASAAASLPAADGDSLAYVIHTSGSTGRPKGVMMGHRGIANRMTWMRAAYPLTAADRVLQKTAFTFDAALWELFLPWASGARVVFARPGGHRDPAYLAQAVDEQGITVLQLVPSMLRMLLEEPGLERQARGLRLLFCGGEAFPEGLQQRVFARLPQTLLGNLYGPTETAIDVAAMTCRREGTGGRVLIGRPIDNATVRVLGGALDPQPIGVPGELYAGGAGVARGYLGRPDLTAERFVPDPFAGEPGTRLYRTGDLGRHLPGGEIEYLGRIDGQVKVRGARIEPGEIEAALLTHPGVGQTVVIVRRDSEALGASLAAYVVPAAGATLSAVALRSHLLSRLPQAMIPNAFVILPELPRTASGKIDRQALPVPRAEDPGLAFVAPATPAEEILAGLWAQVLGVARVGAEDDFFALGGDSLQAIRVVSAVRVTLGIDLPVQALLASRRLSVFARLLAGGREEPPPIAPVPRGGRLPLSFAQERLWFLDCRSPGTPVYNIPLALDIGGPLDPASLEAALVGIVRRHEALRTVLPATTAEGPEQVVLPAAGCRLPRLDVTRLPVNRRGEEAERLAAAEARRPFDLAAGPLFRASLLELAAAASTLLLTVHHAVSDAWSTEILLRELAVLYRTARSNLAPELPELPIQYADFAVWQRRWLAEGAEAAQLAYWRGRLAGAPESFELPVDRPRRAVRSERGDTWTVPLPAPLASRLEQLARHHGATLFMTLFAGFLALLHRVSGAADIVVGWPIAGRTRRETENLIGFFVNTLVLRVDLGGDPPWSALLAQVRAATLEAFAHQDLPFQRLVEELRPGRSPHLNPLFQVLFGLQKVAAAAELAPGLPMAPRALGTGTARTDLTLRVDLLPAGGEMAFEYSTDLFDGATIARLAGHLQVLLAAAVEGPESRLSALPLLTAAERVHLVSSLNATARDFPRQVTIHDRFAAQVARSPEAIAVAMEEDRLTYGELDRQANRLAHLLRHAGTGPDVPVALCLPRSARLVVAMLAVLKAGGAYVPLDLTYPGERLAFMLADTGAPVLLTHGAVPLELAAAPVRRIDLARDAGPIAAASETAFASEAGADHLAYIIYTSGSTGRPKGVAVPHRAVLRLVTGTDYVSLGSDDRIVQISNTNFDAATFEIWGALLNGGCILGIDRPTSLDPARLAAALVDRQATVLFLTTALFNQVAGTVPGALASLDTVLFGGEAVDPGAVQRVLTAGGPRRLLHVYGPTESTTFATAFAVTRVPAEATTVPIGGPIANTTAYVCESNGEPAPLGVPGRLLIGGSGLARGYYGRPDLTSERFVPNAFSVTPGERLYDTGDLVRRDAAGALEFLGRLDDQVKIRGFRIELGEIETILAAHPAVAQAVVVVRRRGAERWLAAYATLRGAAETAELAAELRRFLRARLPEAMVPGAFVFLDALPLTLNGKVDRRALPEPGPERARPQHASRPPSTPVEEIVAGVWTEVLGVEQVAADDDFFSLGGHSLLATQVASRLRAGFPGEDLLRLLFEHPTVAELAARLTAGARRAGVEPPPLVALPRQGELPLSFAQERLYFLSQLAPESPFYNLGKVLGLRGRLNIPALTLALREIVARHEVLRTTFANAGGRPVQTIAAPGTTALPLVDLAALPEPRRAGEALARLTHAGRLPFDLARGPLLRLALLRLGADEHQLLVALHHIACDGWSTGVFLAELAYLYRALVADEPVALPALAVQYADFAVWQRRWLDGAVEADLLAYWLERLRGVPTVLELPTDRPRPAVQAHRGGSRSERVPAAVTAALTALGRREGTTLFMTLLAAFQVLLGRSSGQGDFALGSPIANRNRLEIEPLIGFFVNTLVLRADLGGEPDVRALLARVRESSLGAYRHQDLPFERLVEALDSGRDLSRTPLFQVMFVLQNAPEVPVELPGVDVVPYDLDSGASQFDLTLGVTARDGELELSLVYAADLFDGVTAQRLLAHWQTLLAHLSEDLCRPASVLPLLGAAERHQVEREWNDREAGDGPELSLHARFSRQAARQGARMAVTCGTAGLTYGELEARANRLAHHLVALGVGPESRVGLLLPRSLDLVTAILGVLKAGGAYVPMDPDYPQERLDFLRRDASLALVLSTAGLADGLTGPVVRLDADGAAIERRPATAPQVAVDGGNTAYVIYTSGSTGLPKGVPIQHRNVTRLFTRTEGWFGFGPEDVWTLFHALAFDFSVWELWGALLHGGRLVLVPTMVTRSPAAFCDLLASERVTVLNQTPAAFRQLMAAQETVAAAGAGPAALALSWVIFGGEALEIESLRPWFARFGDRRPRLVNMYGITETTVHVTYRPVMEEDLAEQRVGRIGRPIPDLSVHLLGSGLESVPIGTPGEIHVGGEGLSAGYLNRPQLTAERFLPDPFGGVPGARLYRSGDLARLRPDGDLEYLGRTDQQVKIRGFRVELGEIEAALVRQVGVREAVVVAGERKSAEERRLVAYVTAERDAALTVDGLQAGLRQELPDHMLPAAFVFLAALPLTVNGKVDRRALPAPGAERPRLEAPFVPPRTAGEKTLVAVWEEALGLQGIGVHDNFFTLGGDSIRALRVLAMARERGVEVSLQELFLYRSVAELAAALAAAGRTPAPPEGLEEIDLAALLAEIDLLSDEQTLARLHAEEVRS